MHSFYSTHTPTSKYYSIQNQRQCTNTQLLSFSFTRKDEPLVLETLREQHPACAVPCHQLQIIAAAVGEGVKTAGEHISMGVAASFGYPDCQIITLSEMIDVMTGIVKAVQVPVSVDIEAGYGNNLSEIIESVKKIIATGIVGINIEDSFDLSPVLIDEIEFCERISAIRALSDSLGVHLVINARTDSFYTSSGSAQEKLSESIKRGNKYREAGAVCIFVQPVWDKETISTLVKEINVPINILANPGIGGGIPPSVSELQDLGVARLSLGSGLMKASAGNQTSGSRPNRRER